MATEPPMSKGMRRLAIAILGAGALYFAYVVIDALMTGRLYGHRRSIIEWQSEPELFVTMALLNAVGGLMFARFLIRAIKAPVKPPDAK